MRYFFYILLVILIIGLIFGVFRAWSLGGFVPDLLLLLVLSLSLAFKDPDYLFVALVGGVWMDVLYGLPIGSYAITYIVVGGLSSWVVGKWLFTGSGIKWHHFIIIVLLATMLGLIWIWLYTNALYTLGFSSVALSGAQTIKSGSLTLLANLIFAYPIYVMVELLAQYALRFNRNQIKL